jgi:hypothetical protein
MTVSGFTPKALDSKAQGQRRSRATLGFEIEITTTPKGLHHRFLYNAFSVKAILKTLTQGARQAATLGFGM